MLYFKRGSFSSQNYVSTKFMLKRVCRSAISLRFRNSENPMLGEKLKFQEFKIQEKKIESIGEELVSLRVKKF